VRLTTIQRYGIAKAVPGKRIVGYVDHQCFGSCERNLEAAVVVYNSSPTAQQITLPSGSGTWYVVVYGQTIEPTGTTASWSLAVILRPLPPGQLTIFYQ
jgi:hypothetical protein